MEFRNNRLLLRKLSEADLEFMYILKSNRLVYIFEEDEEPSKGQIYKRYSERLAKMEQEPGKFFILLITKLPEEIPIGEIHIHLDNERTRFWEIGFALHPDYWGKGYVTEAAKLLIAYTFKKLNAHKIMGCCNGNNKKSAACMERIGMQKEGLIREGRLLRNEWCDEYVYSMLDKDYFSNDK
jgi:RimJ/RimL family protein N-acetyltransferase